MGTNVSTDREQNNGDCQPSRCGHDIEVEGDQIPVRRESQEVAVIGLYVGLAGICRGSARAATINVHSQPAGITFGFPDQQKRQRGVGLEVDYVVQPATVEAGQDFLHH